MESEAHLKAGQVLDQRYRVDHLLAAGGFGEVYVVFDMRMDRKVALKYIFRKLNIDQLRNEVTILAHNAERLKFIPNVYDHWAGTPAGIGYYIVMEFIAGETLDKNRPLPWSSDDVIAFVRILLQNLRDLHSLGIVHCDIKPVNIKVTPPSTMSYHVPYMLLDFGIAKQGNDTSVPGASPYYSAPEQHSLGNRLGKLDRRADLYGLAATAYFLLTGRPPIDARVRYTNAFDLSLGDTLPPPSALTNGVASALEATLLDMLQLDRDQRPSSAEEALQLLDRRLSSTLGGAAAAPRDSATELASHSELAGPASEQPRLVVTELPANTDQSAAGRIPIPATAAATAEQKLAAGLLPPPIVIEPTVLPSIIAPALPSRAPEPTIAPIAITPTAATPAVISKEPQPLVAALASMPPPVAAGKAAVLLDKQGHGAITSVAWSLDGRTVLIGTTLGVYQYGIQTNICELWQATDTPVQHVGNTCAGQKVVITDGDLVRVFDFAGTPAPSTLAGATGMLPGRVLTALQGRRIGIVTDDAFYVFNLDTGAQAAAWRLSARLTGRVAALSGDSQTVVIADSDQLWCSSLRSDLRGRQWVISGLPQPLVDLALTPDGQLIAIASPHAIALWRRGDKIAQTLAYTGEPIVKIALSSDGATLAVATDTQVFLRPVNDTDKPKPLIEGELTGVQQLMFSPDDRMLAAASTSELRLWRIRDGSLDQALTQFGPHGQRLAPLVGGHDLAVLGYTLQLWSIDHNQLLPGALLGNGSARSLGVLADAHGEHIAVATDTALQIWNLAAQSLQHHLAALPAQERCLGFAADSRQLLLVTQDSVDVYDPGTGTVRAQVALGDAHLIDHIALAADGRRLALHTNGRIIVRRLPDGDVIATISKTDREITAIGLSADGTQLAVADEAELTVWRIDEDTLIRVGSAPLPEGAPAHHLVFASNGSVLAALHGAAVHIWQVAEGTLRPLGTARGHTDHVTDAIVMPEGDRIITASRDGTLRLWHVPD